MKAGKQHSALEVIKKEPLNRRAFTVEFKAEVVRYKKAENLSLPECGRKFEVLPKLIRDWEKQYDAGQLTIRPRAYGDRLEMAVGTPGISIIAALEAAQQCVRDGRVIDDEVMEAHTSQLRQGSRA